MHDDIGAEAESIPVSRFERRSLTQIDTVPKVMNGMAQNDVAGRIDGPVIDNNHIQPGSAQSTKGVLYFLAFIESRYYHNDVNGSWFVPPHAQFWALGWMFAGIGWIGLRLRHGSQSIFGAKG